MGEGVGFLVPLLLGVGKLSPNGRGSKTHPHRHPSLQVGIAKVAEQKGDFKGLEVTPGFRFSFTASWSLTSGGHLTFPVSSVLFCSVAFVN